MTSCTSVRDNISAYIDQELDPEEQSSFEAHLYHCPDCKKELDEMDLLVRFCSDLPELELPDGFRDEFHAKLYATEQEIVQLRAAKSRKSRKGSSTSSRPKGYKTIRAIASIAAAALILLLAGLFYKAGYFSPNHGQYLTNSAAAAPEMAVADRASDQAAAKALPKESAEAREAPVAALMSVQPEITAVSQSAITVIAQDASSQLDKLDKMAAEAGGTEDLNARESIMSGINTGSDTRDGSSAPVTKKYLIPTDQYDSYLKALRTAYGSDNVKVGTIEKADGAQGALAQQGNAQAKSSSAEASAIDQYISIIVTIDSK